MLLSIVGLIAGVPATQGVLLVTRHVPGYAGLLLPIAVVVTVGVAIGMRSATCRPFGFGLAAGCLMFSGFIAVLMTVLY